MRQHSQCAKLIPTVGLNMVNEASYHHLKFDPKFFDSVFMGHNRDPSV